MTRAPERALRAAVAALVLAGAGLAAQAAVAPSDSTAVVSLPEAEVYRREVFRYPGGGRPDPFQPLLSGDEMGVRAQDLRLLGIVYSSNPRQSVAVFALPDTTQRVRLRVGQRLGAVMVVGIHPRRVDLREDEMGVSRVFSMEVPRAGRPSPPPVVQQPPPQAAPAPQAPAPAASRPR
jgi:hypothetical protein